MFVFETMVKMLFWAEVIYLKEAQDETEPARAVAGVRDPEHVPEKARKGRKGRVSSKPEGSELRPPRAPKARRRATAFQKAWAEETAEYGLPANGSAPDGIGSAGSDASVKSQKPQAMTFEAAGEESLDIVDVQSTLTYRTLRALHFTRRSRCRHAPLRPQVLQDLSRAFV